MSTSELQKTAELVRTVRNDDRGEARLYRLSEPLEGESWVIVSASEFGGIVCETYIFPGNEAGEVTDWGELESSFKGDTDHERALEYAGYKVVGGEAS